MKRFVGIVVLLALLVGCSGENPELERAMDLRAKLIAEKISFDAKITADYGDVSYSFGMACQIDTEGNLSFSVTEPETIAGITGTVSGAGGKLTFADTALAFDLMADRQITPVSAPWVLAKALRSGYLTSCCIEEESLRISVDDSYEEDALHLEVWLDGQDLPKMAEIYWQGRRLLTVAVSNFTVG